MIREEVKKEVEDILKRDKEYRIIRGRPCFLTKEKDLLDWIRLAGEQIAL